MSCIEAFGSDVIPPAWRDAVKGGQKQKPSVASALRREEWNTCRTNSPVASDAAESTQRGTCSGLCCSSWANPELFPLWVHLGLQTLHHALRLHHVPVCQNRMSGQGGCWPLHKRRPTAGHSDAMKQATTISTTLHISHNWTIHPRGFWWTTGSASFGAGPRKPRINAHHACGRGRHWQDKWHRVPPGWPITQGAY